MTTSTEVTTALLFVLQLTLGILTPHWIVRLDSSRLDRTLWLRTWPPASHWCAVVAFGPVAVLVHFLRTRRSAGGVVLGLLGSLISLLPGMLVGLAFPGG